MNESTDVYDGLARKIEDLILTRAKEIRNAG